jgi:energy-coupling factor transporter transmembrane protein EcfT
MVGPFKLKTLIIAILIVVVTTIAMFVLRGPLAFGIVLPIWMLVIVLMIVVVIIFILVSTITSYLRNGKEGFLFATARQEGLNVFLDCELGSDDGEFILAEKASPKDVVLKDEESGIKVDPSMLSSDARPIRCAGGLNIFIFSYYNFMPQTIRNHAAFKAIKNYFDTECEELNFLTIKEFIELVSDPEHYLDRNATIKLNKYFKVSEVKDENGQIEYLTDKNGVPLKYENGEPMPKYAYVRQFQKVVDVVDKVTGEVIDKQTVWVEQDIDLPKMLNHLSKARRDISVLPVMGGLLAGNEAFKYNSVSYSSQHLGHVLMLYYTKMMDDLKGKIDLLTYGIVALMILVGGGVAMYLISMAVKNMGGAPGV